MAIFDSLSRYRPQALGALRIMTALLFISHGTQKLFGFPASQMEGSLPTMLLVAAILEFVGGILVLIGLFTRPVAFILSGQMALPISSRMGRRASSRHSTGVMPPSCSASSSSICSWPVRALSRWMSAGPDLPDRTSICFAEAPRGQRRAGLLFRAGSILRPRPKHRRLFSG